MMGNSNSNSIKVDPVPVRVMVSGAAGQIAYSLLPLLASGRVFGPSKRVSLNLLDITPALKTMSGVKMELEDGAYPLLADVLTTDNAEIALKDVDVAIFVGGFPRKAGMERKDLIAKNCSIFASQGKALEKVASKNVKILVVANPANTNCSILRQNAPSIPDENFTALTFLDMNRARSQLALRLKVPVTSVKRVAIWGNHSATQVPDGFNGLVDGKPLAPMIGDDDWLSGEFVKTIQVRGKAVIEARGSSSAMSAANAIADHVRTWLVTGTEEGDTCSMAVVSKGDYGVEKGLLFSFPCICKNGNWEIAQDYKLSDKLKEMIKLTEKELKEEKRDADTALAAML